MLGAVAGASGQRRAVQPETEVGDQGHPHCQPQRRGGGDERGQGADEHGTEHEGHLVESALQRHRRGDEGALVLPPARHHRPAGARHRAHLRVGQADQRREREQGDEGEVAEEQRAERGDLGEGHHQGDAPLPDPVGQCADEGAAHGRPQAERGHGETAGAVGAGAVGDEQQQAEGEHRRRQPGSSVEREEAAAGRAGDVAQRGTRGGEGGRGDRGE